jgi:hypothetical protein
MDSCFTTVYPVLADRVAAQLPGVWVDLEQGQLLPENESLNYPLPFDAGVVLIDFEEVEWSDQGAGLQEGLAVIRFTLARHVVQDTYTFTGQAGQQRAPAMQQLQLLGELHKALQHYAADGKHFGALVRTNSRKEPGRPGLWAYSMAYKCRLYDAGGYQAPGLATVPDVSAAPVRRTGRPGPAESSIILP